MQPPPRSRQKIERHVCYGENLRILRARHPSAHKPDQNVKRNLGNGRTNERGTHPRSIRTHHFTIWQKPNPKLDETYYFVKNWKNDNLLSTQIEFLSVTRNLQLDILAKLFLPECGTSELGGRNFWKRFSDSLNSFLKTNSLVRKGPGQSRAAARVHRNVELRTAPQAVRKR